MSEPEKLGLPAPSDKPQNGQEDHDPARPETGRTRQRRVRSAAECLQALDQLAGLLALGLVPPAQANAIRATLHEILAHHRSSSDSSSNARPMDRDMLERLRNDPKLMNMMASQLTADQIAYLMGDPTDGDR
jgi:hypothetical protein